MLKVILILFRRYGHSIYQYSKCIIFMIIHPQSFLDFQNIINDEYNIIMISPDVLIFPQISIVIIIWQIMVVLFKIYFRVSK